MGGTKRSKQFFQQDTNSASKKCWEKNRLKTVRKHVFLYSHEYRDQEMGGKKRVKQFFQNHTNSASKKCCEKKSSQKVRKHVFYTHTNIVAKKWGGKKARNNFSRKTRILPAKNVDKKIVSKSAKTRFL